MKTSERLSKLQEMFIDIYSTCKAKQSQLYGMKEVEPFAKKYGMSARAAYNAYQDYDGWWTGAPAEDIRDGILPTDTTDLELRKILDAPTGWIKTARANTYHYNHKEYTDLQVKLIETYITSSSPKDYGFDDDKWTLFSIQYVGYKTKRFMKEIESFNNGRITDAALREIVRMHPELVH